MPDIPKESLNQEVFGKMVGFLTAVSKKLKLPKFEKGYSNLASFLEFTR